MNSIGIKMTAMILIVLLVGISAAVGVSIWQASNIVTKETLAKVNKSTRYEAEMLDKWLTSQTNTIDALAAILSNKRDLGDALTTGTPSSISLQSQTGQAVNTLQPMLSALLDGNASFFETYMGFVDGSAVTGSGYQFDPAVFASYERDWYKLAMSDARRAHVTSPYIDARTGELCLSVARAVYGGGALMGVVGADIGMAQIQEFTLNANAGANSYAMLIGNDGDILVHHDNDYAPDGKGGFRNLATVKDGAYAELWDIARKSSGAFKYTDVKGVAKYYDSVPIPATGWYLIMIMPVSIVYQPINSIILAAIPASIAVLVVTAAFIIFYVRRRITLPLVPLTSFLNKASSSGDISLRQEDIEIIGRFSGSKDEIGQCIKAAAEFVGRITDVSEALGTIAANDLTVELACLSDRDMLGLSLRSMTNQLNEIFTEVLESSIQVSSGSKQIADSAQALAQGATEQAGSVEELSPSMSEIADKTRINADMAGRAAALADNIKNDAEKSSRHMHDMIEAVGEINAASQSISSVIKVIDEIAFQTNILALNAAVEAARAGQHGKGFAVVAEEVRTLAAKSAEAAKETAVLIQNSMQKAGQGSGIAREASESLMEIVNGINESNRLAEEIAASSREQSREIAQINAGIDQVSQVIQHNSATAEESAAASEQMSSQAGMLRESAARFKLRKKDFRIST